MGVSRFALRDAVAEQPPEEYQEQNKSNRHRHPCRYANWFSDPFCLQ